MRGQGRAILRGTNIIRQSAVDMSAAVRVDMRLLRVLCGSWIFLPCFLFMSYLSGMILLENPVFFPENIDPHSRILTCTFIFVITTKIERRQNWLNFSVEIIRWRTKLRTSTLNFSKFFWFLTWLRLLENKQSVRVQEMAVTSRRNKVSQKNDSFQNCWD